MSYELFGNGKTAIKATVSRYVSGTGLQPGFPDQSLVERRQYRDARLDRLPQRQPRDFIPQGDPLNPLPNGEFTGTINPLFGTSLITTRYDPAVSDGWGKRPYNWEDSASVQHELMPRVSLEAGYYRRVFGNFTVTDNLDITPADFTSSGHRPDRPAPGECQWESGVRSRRHLACEGRHRGTPSNQIIRFASDYPGERSQIDNGVDLTVNARPTGRLFLQAGVSTRADGHQDLPARRQSTDAPVL